MIEELVDSLLLEGYALYPYTPGAHKNATPTPFGIVYPAGYEYGFDHLRLECLVRGEDPRVDVEVRFLQASGDRAGSQRRVGVGESTCRRCGARPRWKSRRWASLHA